MEREKLLCQMHERNFIKEKKMRNPCFFVRFPQITFKDKKVMDLGCGLGALTIDIACKGVEKIVGVDIDESVVNFAANNVACNYCELQGKVCFKCADFCNIDENFDLIVSKASFEHFIGLENLLIDIKNKLKIGGKLVAGFGPLYNSPWGDHNRLKHKLPWSHVILPEEYFIHKLNKRNNEKIRDISDLGLNGYSLKKYKEIFYHTEGFSVIDFRTNVSEKKSMKIFNIFSKIPFLKEYFTYNIYCILERTS